MNNINKTMLVTGILSGLLLGCETGSDNPEASDVAVSFAAMVGDESFSCGTTYSGIGVGAAGADTIKLNDFRLYVHDFMLKQSGTGNTVAVELEDDGIWQSEGVAMLDFEDGCLNGTAETNTEVRGVVEADLADYDTLCFTVGVPDELNHIDDATAVSPLNASGMLWSWTSGRKFIRVDGVGGPGVYDQAFHIHLGSTGCVDGDDEGPEPDTACGNSNRPTFCVSGFNSVDDVIAFDIKTVLAASDVTVTSGAPGCMSGSSDPECIDIMPRLNLDFTYNDGVTETTYDKIDPQQFVKVITP